MRFRLLSFGAEYWTQTLVVSYDLKYNDARRLSPRGFTARCLA